MDCYRILNERFDCTVGKNNKCVRFFISRCQYFDIFKYRLLSISFSKKQLRIWNYGKLMFCWWLCKITICCKDYAKWWRRFQCYILANNRLLVTNCYPVQQRTCSITCSDSCCRLGYRTYFIPRRFG